jgi:hypothetical protein
MANYSQAQKQQLRKLTDISKPKTILTKDVDNNNNTPRLDAV